MLSLSRQAQLGLLMFCLPLLYQLYCPQRERERTHQPHHLVGDLARSWRESIHRPERGASRVSVGVNTNLDLIVSATDLLRAMTTPPGQPTDHTSLSSRVQLEEQVSYSMLHCAGTERVFTAADTFMEIVETAYSVDHASSIGGNAALMAEKIHQTQPEIQLMLAGPVGPKLRALLPPAILTPSFSPSSRDEVHLIMEYPKGEEWGAVVSTCANRVITSHDVSNARMVALESFAESLDKFQPDLVILSGAHLMEGQGREFQRGRLQDIARVLDSIPPSIPIHWELATIGDLTYLRDLGETIFPRIDSLGLNEQELVSFTKSSGATFNFSSVPAKPGVPVVSDLLHWLVQTHGFLGQPGSRLSRVHFHTLSFHVIATLEEGGRWGNSVSAVLAGAQVAGLQACNLPDFDPPQFEIRAPLSFPLSFSDTKLSRTTMDITPDAPVASWVRGGVAYHLTPVLVCREPVRTVGLGDAISSLGLLFSQFNH